MKVNKVKKISKENQPKPFIESKDIKAYHLKDGIVFQGDNLKAFDLIKDCTVSLVFTSPPYNILKDYGTYKEKETFFDYFDYTKKWLKQAVRVLKGYGFLVINIPASIVNLQDDSLDLNIIPFSFEYQKILNSIPELEYFGQIVWDKGMLSTANLKVINAKKYNINPPFLENYELLLIYRKKPSKINRKVQQLNIADIDFFNYSYGIWRVSPENFRRSYHPVPFPITLAQRVISFFSDKGDYVLDCFSGIGTTLLASVVEKRKFIGMELNPSYVKHFLIDYENLQKHFIQNFE